jgi:predicted SAM-dependent methyltransferase
MIFYSIDDYSWNLISGWAFSESKKKLRVNFFVDDKLIGYCIANQYRKDLESIYDSKGFISFNYKVDKRHRFKAVTIIIDDLRITPSFNPNLKRDLQILHFYKVGFRSLEIGALDHPIISSKDKNNYFADHFLYNDLIKKYKKRRLSTKLNYQKFAPVDMKLDSILNTKKKYNFDYVVASHFLEHYPNPIHFLRKISHHIKLNGYLALALPDKRFTFDKNFDSTTYLDWIDWYFSNFKKPKFSNIYNSNLLKNKNSNCEIKQLIAFDDAHRDFSKKEYYDCHVSYFSKNEFISIIKNLFDLNLITFNVVKIFICYTNSEFIVILKNEISPTLLKNIFSR